MITSQLTAGDVGLGHRSPGAASFLPYPGSPPLQHLHPPRNSLEPPLDPREVRRRLVPVRLHFRADVVLRVPRSIVLGVHETVGAVPPPPPAATRCSATRCSATRCSATRCSATRSTPCTTQ
jgi:hypothetical protein